MRSSESTAELSKAFVAATLLLKNPTKEHTVSTGRYSYSYADLASILDEVRPTLQAHGLVLVQEAAAADRGVGVATRIIHASGEWLEFDALVMPAGDAQATGSAITYARRYALCAALGIAADEDDDGKQASGAGAADRGKGSPAPAKRSEAGATSNPSGEEAAAPASECKHDWKPSDKLKSFDVCFACGDTRRRT